MGSARKKAILTVLNGRHKGETFIIEGDGETRVIGRDNNCNIQILDKGISRNHSKIDCKGDHFLLLDMQSTNGTFVNNKAVVSKRLENGDHLRIGQTEITFTEQPVKEPTQHFETDGQVNVENLPNTFMARVNVSQSLIMSAPKLPKHDIASLYLSTIYEVSNIINAEQDQTKLFEGLMDKIMEVFKPHRGFLVLKQENGFQIMVRREAKSKSDSKFSHSILQKTMIEGLSILSANAMLDDRFSSEASIISQEIKSVMCVPLESSKGIEGAIYLDFLGAGSAFNKSHLELLTAIGNQAGVAVERIRLFSDFMERQRLEESLSVARNIQRSLLPSGIPDNFEYDMEGINWTCDETGGDYYDYYSLPGGKWGLVIGDVSGHGVGAALLMATARAFLKGLSLKSTSITQMMDELNFLLCKDMDSDKFMTLFYGELEPRHLVLNYVNAGHESPIIYRRGQNEFESLLSTGFPLGIEDDTSYEQERVTLHQGDILLMFTDGITEAKNKDGEQFGSERLLDVVAANADRSAAEILKECQERQQAFCSGESQKDDITMMVIKFEKRPKEMEMERQNTVKK